MKHIAEDDLIALQLGEAADGTAIREHLEQCSECAATAESIAETLRVFSAGPVPPANLDHAWQRMRGSLPVLPAEARRSWGRRGRLWMWPAAGAAVAALLLVIFAGIRVHRGVSHEQAKVTLHRSGPLTDRPVDPAIANHLDGAERLLTEVNHASGPLEESTRSQAHDLLLQNAIYVRRARDQGDLAEASVLENLGRVLTTLDHEPPASAKGWHIRFEMNTDGLLLEIRILRQNDGRQ